MNVKEERKKYKSKYMKIITVNSLNVIDQRPILSDWITIVIIILKPAIWI